LVRIQDLLDSLTKLQKASSDAKSTQIEEALKALDDNTDGCIDVNVALEVIEMLGKHKDVEISPAQIKKIIELLKKEDAIEEIDQNEQQ
jgi:Ca2+-binding EF-hand superfamily protein